MCRINFGVEVLQPIPESEPRAVPLRRRASAPELANFGTLRENVPEPYETGNCLRLQLQNASGQKVVAARSLRLSNRSVWLQCWLSRSTNQA